MLSALQKIGISLEQDAARLATRFGAKPIGWPAGAQPGSLIYRLPSDPAARASLFAREQGIRVSEGEVAVVLRDGALVGTMEPGAYRVDKARVVGDVDVVWIKTGPRMIRWGVGNVTTLDGIQTGANGTLSVRVVDGARFNTEVVQGALTLPESELQRILMPGIQAVLRSMLASGEARTLLAEREEFTRTISRSAAEHLLGLGLAVSAFEVVEFNLPPEFREAIASETLASARGKGQLAQARTDAQQRLLEAESEAAAALLAGQARAKVMETLRAAGIDPMGLEAMEALKKFAEAPSMGVLGGDAAKAGLIGSVAAAALQASQALRPAAAETPPAAGHALGQIAAGSEQGVAPPAQPDDTRASLERQIDGLVERLALGEIGEETYNRLVSRLERKLEALEGGAGA